MELKCLSVLLFLIIPVVSASHGRKLYVVHLKDDVQQYDYQHNHAMLSTVLGSLEAAKESMIYNYKHGLKGFAAHLTSDQASSIARLEGVQAVFPNKLHRVHTTHSWNFLGVTGSNLWSNYSESRDAQNVIIGMLDTGIWPESPSFHDAGMDPVPKRWRGACIPGDAFSVENCNRKIIGARFYFKGISSERPLNARGSKLSARDDEGHGTHTASTAAGRLVGPVSFPGGIAEGTARGGAPLARLAIYKVCWNSTCADVDILAAMDDAIGDGVDIISLSLGPEPPEEDVFTDSISVGSFHAMRRGILVVASAGNNGLPGTATNVSPWILTVAASSIDRGLESKVVLGNGLSIKGEAVNPDRIGAPFLVLASNIPATGVPSSNASFCLNNTLDASKVRNNIIVCLQESPRASRVLKGAVVKQLGGAGMVLADEISKDVAMSFLLPATIIGAKELAVITNYVNETSYPVATILPTVTVLDLKPSPAVAVFSSKGPSSVVPDILKPDITAPGVSILAAWSPLATAEAGGRAVDYNIISGTSMSCPHVTGVAATLKAKYPSWSPAAIKSAIMTTASTLDNTGKPIRNQFFQTVAGPFDFGAGHVRPVHSLEPGLIYDTGFHEYVGLLCGLGSQRELRNLTQDGTACPKGLLAPYNLNYPSITISNLTGRLVVHRTVTNVGPVSSVYKVAVKPPAGVHVNVHPEFLSFTKVNERKSFSITFQVETSTNGSFVFGSLAWSDGRNSVVSPIAVRT